MILFYFNVLFIDFDAFYVIKLFLAVFTKLDVCHKYFIYIFTNNNISYMFKVYILTYDKFCDVVTQNQTIMSVAWVYGIWWNSIFH